MNQPQLAINDYAKYISQWRESKGFVTSWDNMLEKLMLVVTEVSEAAEDYRHDNRKHFAEELADCFIRLMDITDALDIDIEAEIIAKMEKNKARPYQHGTVNGDVLSDDVKTEVKTPKPHEWTPEEEQS